MCVSQDISQLRKTTAETTIQISGGRTGIASRPTQDISSGTTTLLLSMLAQATGCGEFCALADGNDCFDPVSAEDMGIDLTRLLWVRCREREKLKRLEKAFKAADILIHNGGFGLIAVDLSGIEEQHLRKVPLTTWFRFARVVEKMPTTLVFLMSYPAARSCAGLTLQMRAEAPCWTTAYDLNCGTKSFSESEQSLFVSTEMQQEYAITRQQDSSKEQRDPSGKTGSRLLSGMTFHAEVSRSRLRKHVQSVRPQFSAKAVWG